MIVTESQTTRALSTLKFRVKYDVSPATTGGLGMTQMTPVAHNNPTTKP